MFARLSFLIVLAVFSLAACCEAPPAEEPGVDVAAEEQAIRGASIIWLQATQAKDAATIDGIFDADAVTIFDGEIYEGLAAIRANREEGWAEQPEGTITWTTTGLEVAASGDFAYERGNWTSDPDGAGEAPEEYGEFLTVWKKVEGNWKVLYDAGSRIKAKEEPATEG